MDIAEVNRLRAAHRVAADTWGVAKDADSPEEDRLAELEQQAWDAFRDACDELNGDRCDHPECPQPLERN